MAELAAYRRTLQKHAAVSWGDRNKINKLYEEAERLTRETGIKHNVDHIVPIVNDRICGLHVEGNLQVLTAYENQSKNNRFDIEQENERLKNEISSRSAKQSR